MSDMEMMTKLREAVQDLDKEQLLELLHCGVESCDISREPDLFGTVTEALIAQPECAHTATQIVYILSIYGADVNIISQEDRIPVLEYLKSSCDTLSTDFVQAILRCGQDLTIKDKFASLVHCRQIIDKFTVYPDMSTQVIDIAGQQLDACTAISQEGESLLSYILHSGAISRNFQELVLSYMPGIWKAVGSDDAMSVRKLVNQWCSIRITKEEKSVLQLAFEKGTENIIRVITGIGASMDFAHGVLAGDVQYVRNLLNSSRKLNINIKNLSDRGATPLFYALSHNNCDMVDLLLENGARLDVTMQGENEMELPLYFTALSSEHIEEYLLEKAIPVTPVPVDQLYYRGRNVLFYCIEHNISANLFEEILRKCSAYVLTQKIEKNVSARDYAVKFERHELVSRIDKVVSEWIYYSTNKKNRNILALHGYKHVPALQDLNCENSSLDDCFLDLADYENHKILLTQAVEDGDLVSVREMLYYESVLEKGLETCMADCRCNLSGQPLLHKAVLRGYPEITRLLADTLVHVTRQKIDSIRDQYFRTCLHYAYGMEEGKDIINILEEHGASEFSMDKDGRSPLAFKDRQGQKEMKKLLQYHLAQDFCKEEPDPWSVPLPMPIMGYISKCLHNHHHKEQQGTKPVTCDQYDKIDLKTSPALISSDSDDFGQQYSQIKQNEHHSRAKPKKHVRISHHAHHENGSDKKMHKYSPEAEEKNKYSEPFQQEVDLNQTGTNKSQTKNGVSFNLRREVDYPYRSGSDYVTSQQESLEHSDSFRTSSVDTESEGSEEYEADNSSSEEEEPVQTLEQKYCKIL